MKIKEKYRGAALNNIVDSIITLRDICDLCEIKYREGSVVLYGEECDSCEIDKFSRELMAIKVR